MKCYEVTIKASTAYNIVAEVKIKHMTWRLIYSTTKHSSTPASMLRLNVVATRMIYRRSE